MNPLKILKLPLKSTTEQIKTQYHILLKQYHPDTSTTPDTMKLMELQKAYKQALRYAVDITNNTIIYRDIEIQYREQVPFAVVKIPFDFEGTLICNYNNNEYKVKIDNYNRKGGYNSPINIYNDRKFFVFRLKIVEWPQPPLNKGNWKSTKQL